MNTLVERFVSGVYSHVRFSNVSEDHLNAMRALLPILDSDAPTTTKTTVLATLRLVQMQGLVTMAPLHIEGGSDRLIRFILDTDLFSVPTPTIHDACELLLCGKTNAVLTFMRTNAMETHQTIPALLAWFACSDGVTHIFQLVSTFLLPHGLTARELYPHKPVEVLSRHVFKHAEVLRNELHVLTTAWSTLTQVVEDAPALFQRFWMQCGPLLLEALAVHQITDQSSGLLPRVHRLLQHVPSCVAVSLPPSTAVLDALTIDVLADGDVGTVLSLSCNESIFSQFIVHGEFVAAMLLRSTERFPVLDTATRMALTDWFLLCASRPDGAPLPNAVLEVFCLDLIDEPTRQKRALLAATALGTDAMVPHFESLLSAASPEDELDVLLCSRFEQLEREPSLLCTHVFALEGQPKLLLFHCIECLLGPGYAPAKCVTDARIRSFLATAITSARSHNSCGTELYCRHIARRFHIQGVMEACPLMADENDSILVGLSRCISHCSVTLEPMHCPVVASDGLTYELSAMVSLFRTQTPPLSPITRATLQPFVVFNQRLGVVEHELWSTANALQRRVRRRRRDARSVQLLAPSE